MAKKNKKEFVDIATLQPDELHALKETMREFIKRLANVDNEIRSLQEGRRELVDEYREKLDTKTLATAIKVAKIEAGIEHKGTYETFVELLRDDFVNELTD